MSQFPHSSREAPAGRRTRRAPGPPARAATATIEAGTRLAGWAYLLGPPGPEGARQRLFARLGGLTAIAALLAYLTWRITSTLPAGGWDRSAAWVLVGFEALPLAGLLVRVVTLWNVIEHVPDTPRLLGEAVRVLRPGGRLFLLAPNYLAFRREAHYLVPWLPLLPRPVARCYLRVLGRDPRFLDEEIVYCTAPGVRRALRRLPVRIVDPRLEKLGRPEAIVEPRARAVATVTQRAGASTVLGFALGASARNPLRKAIQVEAVKQGGGR